MVESTLECTTYTDTFTSSESLCERSSTSARIDQPSFLFNVPGVANKRCEGPVADCQMHFLPDWSALPFVRQAFHNPVLVFKSRSNISEVLDLPCRSNELFNAVHAIRRACNPCGCRPGIPATGQPATTLSGGRHTHQAIQRIGPAGQGHSLTCCMTHTVCIGEVAVVGCFTTTGGS